MAEMICSTPNGQGLPVRSSVLTWTSAPTEHAEASVAASVATLLLLIPLFARLRDSISSRSRKERMLRYGACRKGDSRGISAAIRARDNS